MIKTLTITLSLLILSTNSFAQTEDVNRRSVMQCKKFTKSIDRIENKINTLNETIRTREISLSNSKFDVDLASLKQKKTNYDRLQDQFCKDINLDSPTKPATNSQCDRLKSQITRLENRVQSVSRRGASRIQRQIDNLSKRYDKMCEASD